MSTAAERLALLEREGEISRQRITAIEEVLAQTVETNNARVTDLNRLLLRTIEANNTTAHTVGVLADKIDQLVEALLHPGTNGGRK